MMEIFKQHIESALPFLKDKKLLLAVSGGVDSVVLLDVFAGNEVGSVLGIAHFNFQLRGEDSEQDARFVKDLSEKYQVHFHIQSENTDAYAEKNRLSIQLAARKLRYDWFEIVLREHSYDYLLTAHHLDDQVETFFVNFTRGTGIEGLLGIPEIQNQVVRPLLPFSKQDIMDYARENNLSWREDISNASDKYYRNKIRHHIVPVLKELNPSFLSSFLQTTAFLKQNHKLTKDAILFFKEDVCRIQDDVMIFDIEKMRAYKNWKEYLIQILRPLGFYAFQDIFHLWQAENGKSVFGKGYFIEKNPKELLLIPDHSFLKDENYMISADFNTDHLPIPLLFELKKKDLLGTVEKNCIFADNDQIAYPLKLRRPQKKDVFYPFGMKGRKKEVFKYFRDEKFSTLQKNQIWILEDALQRILWIVGYRADERFRISERTNNLLKITIDL